mgnify:FL=1
MLGPWLLAAYLEAKLREKASRHTGELLNEYRRLLFGRGPQLAGPLAQFGLCLLRMNRYADAEALLRESLTLRQKVQPNAWTTFNTQSMLGEALLGRAQSVSDGSEKKLYAEAEPLLLKGYEGMKAREKTIPPQGVTRIPEALDRLIELYRVTRKPDEVRKYRALRDAYPPRTLPLPQVVD